MFLRTSLITGARTLSLDRGFSRESPRGATTHPRARWIGEEFAGKLSTGSCANFSVGVGSDRLGGPSPSDNQYDWEFDYPGGGANVNVSRHWCQRQQRRFRWTCHQQVRDYPVCEAVASCTDNDAASARASLAVVHGALWRCEACHYPWIAGGSVINSTGKVTQRSV